MYNAYLLDYTKNKPTQIRTAPVEIASFPANPANEPQARADQTHAEDVLLEWLDEADYNWFDAPATFDR
jgi:hypothetical protein